MNNHIDTNLNNKPLSMLRDLHSREIGSERSIPINLYLHTYIKNLKDQYEEFNDFVIKSHEKFRANELFKEILHYDNQIIKSFDINLLITAMIKLGFDIKHKDRWTTVWEGHTYTPLVATFYKLITDEENTNHYLNLFEVLINHGADLKNETTFFSSNIQHMIQNNFDERFERNPNLNILLDLIEKFENNHIG